MKCIGFIREYDLIQEAKPFAECIGAAPMDPGLLESMLKYLDSGTCFMGWMEYCMDLETGKPAVPHGFFTDGVWAWPAYLPYYLRKHPEFMLAPEFIAHAQSLGFVAPQVAEKQCEDMDEQLMKKLNEMLKR